MLNTFLRKPKNLLDIKTQKQTDNSIMCGYFCIGFKIMFAFQEKG